MPPPDPETDQLPPSTGQRLVDWLHQLTTPGRNPFEDLDDEPERHP
jgi:hypothetical protein